MLQMMLQALFPQDQTKFQKSKILEGFSMKMIKYKGEHGIKYQIIVALTQEVPVPVAAVTKK